MAEGVLRVAIARAADDPGAVGSAPDWMCGEERQRWTTLRDAGRRAFVASRRLLRETLAEATGLAAEGWHVSAEPGVAPVASRLDLGRDAAPPISIAHRLGWVAVAVGTAGDGAIGVDIECDGVPSADLPERAALVMPRGELARWQALHAGERAPALMRAWVAREAWFKAAGAGAPWDFRRLDCAPCDAGEANVRVWEAGSVRVALSASDAEALAAASCDGWPVQPGVDTSYWHVRAVAAVEIAPA